MAVYLVKDANGGRWLPFSREEINVLRARLDLIPGLRKNGERDYIGPNNEYIGIGSQLDRIQLQKVKYPLLKRIKKITQPRYFTTDSLVLAGDNQLKPISDL
ncbi:MAG: hypothetical protein KJ600_06380 [Nanoarchaeota archaeon]|nr:hypothetical protein [Nanoarchaeota archaeon]MBU1104152.1 hypothetical protein [Nanoarchaeota archaeon]